MPHDVHFIDVAAYKHRDYRVIEPELEWVGGICIGCNATHATSQIRRCTARSISSTFNKE
jgi:hypothetical protein